MIGSQSVVDQAPRGGPPDICPILNEDAGNLLLTRILLLSYRHASETVRNLPFQTRICSRHSQGLLRYSRHTEFLPGKVLWLYPSFAQLRLKK
jgi:hypothetical protein